MPNKSQKSFTRQSFSKKNLGGLTLIELLVVIATIALIVSIVVVAVSGARTQARDAKRQTELDQTRKALEIHFLNKGKYPTTTDWISLEEDDENNGPFSQAMKPDYLSTIPRDPLYPQEYEPGEKYSYQYRATTTESYEIYAKREQGGFFEISSELGSVTYSPEGPRWLSGYSFRKMVTLNGSTGAGTDYQVKLKIGKTSAASGEDFDLNSHVLDSFNDIGFTDNDKTILLDYWIEKIEDSGGTKLATVWVKVKDDLSSGTVDIYIYYDNPSAVPDSNGTATFDEFFDDFAGTSLDTTKWEAVINGGSIAVANSIVTIQSSARDKRNAEIISEQGFEFGNIMETYAKVTEGSNDYNYLGRASNFTTGGWGEKNPAENYLYQYRYTYPNPDSESFSLAKNSTYTSVATTVPLNTWNIIGMFSNGTTAEYRRDGNLIVNITNSTYCPESETTAKIFMLAFSYATNSKIEADWVRVRKYVSPEPSFSSAGSEKSL